MQHVLMLCPVGSTVPNVTRNGLAGMLQRSLQPAFDDQVCFVATVRLAKPQFIKVHVHLISMLGCWILVVTYKLQLVTCCVLTCSAVSLCVLLCPCMFCCVLTCSAVSSHVWRCPHVFNCVIVCSALSLCVLLCPHMFGCVPVCSSVFCWVLV